jgi:hypothetical protein
MLEIAGVLSRGIPYVRVDLYLVDDRIYFGELTFYPEGGLGKFSPPGWDGKLGQWLNLNALEGVSRH